MVEKSYLFSLNYENRMSEKEFIKEILKEFDDSELVGIGIYVNNNPYNLEMLLYLNFQKSEKRFEDWLNINYKNKRRLFNYFIDDILASAFTNGYNFATFIDEKDVDMTITNEANLIFLYPDKESMKSLWKTGIVEGNGTIFLSHSSKDKNVVDKIFNEIQKHNIRAWYDKYEIEPGDSITDKINDGLNNSDIGILCISRNFLNSEWAKGELKYFIQRRMRSVKKDFICLNFDVPHDELPPLVQDYKYIDMKEDNAIDILIKTLKKSLSENK